MKPITHIQTPYSEKFGVPRQPLLIPEAWGKMTFPKDDFFSEAFRGIEGFSHMWLIFHFHQVEDGNFSALVRPPRYEGKKKIGLYATRSPHRPNRLGLSVIKFERLDVLDKEIHLWVSGVDVVDGTPILDIKPYLPYVDKVVAATSQDFELRPDFKEVVWLCEKPEHATLIEKVIGLDPRPSHKKETDSEYGVSVAGLNVRFKEEEDRFVVFKVST